jgi:hypothetical protein
MKVKELIKTLCDFNPNADVEVLYNNGALLINDISWNWGDDDSPVNNTNKGEVKCVHLWALDPKQMSKCEEEFRKQFEEIAMPRQTIEGNTKNA